MLLEVTRSLNSLTEVINDFLDLWTSSLGTTSSIALKVTIALALIPSLFSDSPSDLSAHSSSVLFIDTSSTPSLMLVLPSLSSPFAHHMHSVISYTLGFQFQVCGPSLPLAKVSSCQSQVFNSCWTYYHIPWRSLGISHLVPPVPNLIAFLLSTPTFSSYCMFFPVAVTNLSVFIDFPFSLTTFTPHQISHSFWFYHLNISWNFLLSSPTSKVFWFRQVYDDTSLPLSPFPRQFLDDKLDPAVPWLTTHSDCLSLVWSLTCFTGFADTFVIFSLSFCSFSDFTFWLYGAACSSPRGSTRIPTPGLLVFSYLYSWDALC